MEQEIPAVTAHRPRGITYLGILTGTGGVLGALAGLWFATARAGVGWSNLLLGVAALALSGAELAFAWGAWRQSRWALKPGWRVVGVALAIALIALGIYVMFSIPIRGTGKLAT